MSQTHFARAGHYHHRSTGAPTRGEDQLLGIGSSGPPSRVPVRSLGFQFVGSSRNAAVLYRGDTRGGLILTGFHRSSSN